jgi:hypothetical protein
VARALDAEKHGADAAVREKAAGFIALMTPVVKALFTDLGFESASLPCRSMAATAISAKAGWSSICAMRASA